MLLFTLGCGGGGGGGPSGSAGTQGGGGTGAGAGTSGSAGTTGTGGGTAGTGSGGTTSGAAGVTGGGGAVAGTSGGTAGTAGGAAGTTGGGGATAGTSGTAGRGGTTGGGGTTGAGGGTAGGGGAGPAITPFLTETFESGTNGMQPAGWDNFIGYVKNNPQNPQGDVMAVVDGARAHGGTKSVHFKGGSSPAMITRPLPANTNKLYVRAWFYMSRQLGMNPNANHETLIGIRKTTGNANDEVRFGEIKGVIGTNEVPTDNISPKMAQWGMGPVIPANSWQCIEVAFLADQAQHTLYAWHGGTMVHSITAGDQWQNGAMPANWMNGKFVEVILGWHSFSNANADIWMDDLALSTGPIGCN